MSDEAPHREAVFRLAIAAQRGELGDAELDDIITKAEKWVVAAEAAAREPIEQEIRDLKYKLLEGVPSTDREYTLSLEARVAELEADRERLDWLDESWVRVQKFPNFDWMSSRSAVHPHYHGKVSDLTLRAAIDAARGEEDGDA